MKKNTQLSLSGKVVLITGAAGGLGSSIVEMFGSAGAKLFLSSFHEEKLKKLSDSLNMDNVPNYYKAIDITAPGSATELANEVINKLGTIDILVNCAGVNTPQKAEDVTEKNWDNILDINLKATFFLCQAAGKEMIKNKSGKIVNISSQAGIVALPLRSAYCSSKAGVNNLTRELACEWAKYNITVNAVAPTFVRTPFTKNMFADKNF
jgi:NAD(P)-dependent dehydrogenase (short-subunit alcohol dehydrogenase family)